MSEILADILVVHLEEQRVGELLQLAAVWDAVVAQHAAAVPDTLDDMWRSSQQYLDWLRGSV
jgi:hypothetical protein